MRAIVVDAYDSFVYTICLYLRRAGVDVTVVRVDRVDAHTLLADDVDVVVLGPGPGHPAECGYLELLDVVVPAAVPVLGVCLGHQAIGLHFGGEVVRADNLMHGKSSSIEHDGAGVFADLPPGFRAMRYHSLIVGSVGDPLVVTARSGGDGYIMGLRHCDALIESVQFHPESVGTPDGHRILENFLARLRSAAPAVSNRRTGEPRRGTGIRAALRVPESRVDR